MCQTIHTSFAKKGNRGSALKSAIKSSASAGTMMKTISAESTMQPSEMIFRTQVWKTESEINKRILLDRLETARGRQDFEPRMEYPVIVKWLRRLGYTHLSAYFDADSKAKNAHSKIL